MNQTITTRPHPFAGRYNVVTKPREAVPTMFADLPPCLGRTKELPGGGVGSSVRNVETPAPCCGGTALVEIADCMILSRPCTVQGISVNEQPTAKCDGCRYQSPPATTEQ